MKLVFSILMFLMMARSAMAQYGAEHAAFLAAVIVSSPKSNIKLITGKMFVRAIDPKLIGKDFSFVMNRCQRNYSSVIGCKNVENDTYWVNLSEQPQQIQFEMREFDAAYPLLVLRHSDSFWKYKYSEFNVEDLKRSPSYYIQNSGIEIKFQMDKK